MTFVYGMMVGAPLGWIAAATGFALHEIAKRNRIAARERQAAAQQDSAGREGDGR